MKARTLIIFLSAVLISGCAHSTMRGSVAMKVSDGEAHICMGHHEVKAGDHITLYKNLCPTAQKKFDVGASCTKQKIGDGLITRILNEHYSVAKIDSGVPFEEGTIVEKN